MTTNSVSEQWSYIICLVCAVCFEKQWYAKPLNNAGAYWRTPLACILGTVYIPPFSLTKKVLFFRTVNRMLMAAFQTCLFERFPESWQFYVLRFNLPSCDCAHNHDPWSMIHSYVHGRYVFFKNLLHESSNLANHKFYLSQIWERPDIQTCLSTHTCIHHHRLKIINTRFVHDDHGRTRVDNFQTVSMMDLYHSYFAWIHYHASVHGYPFRIDIQDEHPKMRMHGANERPGVLLQDNLSCIPLISGLIGCRYMKTKCW